MTQGYCQGPPKPTAVCACSHRCTLQEGAEELGPEDYEAAGKQQGEERSEQVKQKVKSRVTAMSQGD